MHMMLGILGLGKKAQTEMKFIIHVCTPKLFLLPYKQHINIPIIDTVT